MATIHIMLQGKGGCGKSLFSSITAEYFMHKGIEPVCIDLDPLNQTFASFTGLKAKHIDLIRGGLISQSLFDDLFTPIIEADANSVFVVDNGAANFVNFLEYVSRDAVFDAIQELGHTIYIHTVIAGGTNLADTISGVTSLVSYFPKVPIVIWRNSFFGSLSYKGKPLDDMPAFKKISENLYAQIEVVELESETQGSVFAKMRTNKLTFDEALNSDQFSWLQKLRLRNIRKGYFAALDAVNF